MMEVKARSKPLSIAERTVRPARSSSRIRSKTSTLASTAMPMVKMTPAMPGRVSVEWNSPMPPNSSSTLHQRADRVDAAQPVVQQHHEHHQRAADDAGAQPLADRVAAQRRPDRALLEIGYAGRQRARAQHRREVLDLLLGEAALDDARVADPRADHRRRDDLAVEDDGQAGADVLAGQRRERPGAVRREVELDDRLVHLAELRPGAAQVPPGHRAALLDRVEQRRGAAGVAVAPLRGDDLDVVGHPAAEVLHDVLAGDRMSPVLRVDGDAEFEEGGVLDQLAHAIEVVDSRQLHDDAVAAGGLDDRFGDAVGVDAVADGLHRLVDRLVAQLGDVGGEHLEDHAVAPLAVVEARQDALGRLDHRGLRLGRQAGDHDAGVAGALRLDLELALGVVLDLLHQARHVGVGLGPQRVLGVDLQHEMHAAAEVETEVDLLLRRGGGGHRRQDRDEDQHSSPEQVAIHGLPPFSASGSRPVIADFATLTLTLSATLSTTMAPVTAATSP